MRSRSFQHAGVFSLLWAVACGSGSGSLGAGAQAGGASSGAAASGSGSVPGLGGASSGGSPGGGSTAGGSPTGAISGDGPSGGTAGGAPSGGAGSGGRATGGESSGGSGAAPAGGSGSALTPGDVVPLLDGFLYKGECKGGSASFECPLSACTDGVFLKTQEFQVAGEAGSTYDITVHVYGVTELRSDYKGGMRRKGAASNAQCEGDFLYVGGDYTPGAGYNVYSVRVEPAVAEVPATDGGNNYFLNARDSTGEGHEVYALDFEVTFPVPAGGTLTFTAYDPNCLQIMNNSETVRPKGSGTGPSGALVIDGLEKLDPPPQDLVQPLSTAGRTGQWVLVDVTQIKKR